MFSLNRRAFLGGVALAAPAGLVARGQAPGAGAGIHDVHAYVGRWPFRRAPGDRSAGELAGRLRARGVARAWVGSLEAPFHDDLGGVNARLAAACRAAGDGLLVPIGAVNPTLPDWEDELRRCHELHGMPAIRLHPNYHRYALDDPAPARLLDQAARRGLVVQLVAWMEDARQQNPLMIVPEVDLAPLAGVVGRLDGLRLVVLNGMRNAQNPALAGLAATGRVWFDFANLEGLAGLGGLLDRLPVDRVVFGSYAPLFPVESNRLKLTEAGIDGPRAEALLWRNAAALLAG